MEEYVNDKVDRKNLKKNLHNTPALKKSCDDRNNARNRDVYALAKARDSLSDIEEMKKMQLELEMQGNTEELLEEFNNLDNSEKKSSDNS